MVVSQSVRCYVYFSGSGQKDGRAMLKVVVVGAKNNLANQTFMSYDMTLIDYMKDRILTYLRMYFGSYLHAVL